MLKSGNRIKKVAVALSGGVDSAVSAYLLKKQGFQVIGIFMYNWNDRTMKTVDLNNCPQGKDLNDAKAVCKKLGIPFYQFNFVKQYRNKVFNYFIREYKKGRTPNPDMLCNREIKFNIFLKKARKLKIDYVATGHYAQIKNKHGKHNLHRGMDKNKDQSYFLADVKYDNLKNVLFPVGKITKQKVRQIAKEINLPVAEKKDSQGVCFIGDIEVRKFLRRFLKKQSGKIIDQDTKEILGNHDGAYFYTIGQRQGLKIASDLPYYVSAIDVKKNIVYAVKGSKNSKLFRKEIVLEKLNWLPKAPKTPIKITAQIRYRQKAQNAVLKKSGKNRYKLIFTQKQRAVTPGQFAVIYQRNKVLGCGVIV